MLHAAGLAVRLQLLPHIMLQLPKQLPNPRLPPLVRCNGSPFCLGLPGRQASRKHGLRQSSHVQRGSAPAALCAPLRCSQTAAVWF